MTSSYLLGWEAKDDDRRTEFVYLLEWVDDKTKSAAWARFMADEESKEIKHDFVSPKRIGGRACPTPRWTPKTGQSWTPENRPVR